MARGESEELRLGLEEFSLVLIAVGNRVNHGLPPGVVPKLTGQPAAARRRVQRRRRFITNGKTPGSAGATVDV